MTHIVVVYARVFVTWRHTEFTCQVDGVIGYHSRCVSYNRRLILIVLKEIMRKTILSTILKLTRNEAGDFTILKICTVCHVSMEGDCEL